MAIALITVDKLFEYHINGDIFLDLLFVSTFILQAWVFLSGIPKDLAPLNQRTDYPNGLRIFVRYLLIPLVSLYLLIPYVYAAKIIFTRVWPNGYVGWLVSVMALLFIAVGKRVSAYGLTEARYILILLGAYASTVAIYFLIARRPQIRWVPIDQVSAAEENAGAVSGKRISLRSVNQFESLDLKGFDHLAFLSSAGSQSPVKIDGEEWIVSLDKVTGDLLI